MKKTSKNFIISLLLIIMVFAFTGCSKNKVETDKLSTEEKIIATKIVKSDIVGEYETRFEFVFENEKLIKVINTSILKTENQAEVFMAAVSASENEILNDIEFEQDDNKVIMKMNASTYALLSNTKTLTKDVIKNDMEKSGYTIK